ncbi:MAG: type II secretion system protein GspL [Rhodoferax sp.]|nr:type II secretion system protein GspL [Rhodoferax sp.]
MPRILCVALPGDRPCTGGALDYVVSLDGRTPERHGSAPLAALPAAERLILVVPASMLSWHQVSLPPVASSRLPGVLAGLLEDRLLDDPGALAFALGPQANADGSRTVSVCDRAWLRAALDSFEQVGRMVTRVVPQVWPAADDGSQRRLLALGTPDAASLVVVERLAVLCGPFEPGPAWQGADGTDFAALPLFAQGAVLNLAERALQRTATLVEGPTLLLGSSQSPWELAQFDLAISRRGRMARRWTQTLGRLWQDARWRPLRWGALALVVANLFGLNAWAWRLDASLVEKRAQTKSLLIQSFPGVRTVVDAPLQMERELALLRRSSGALGQNDLEAMLAALVRVLPGGEAAQAVNFSNGDLRVTGAGLATTQVAAANSQLGLAGYAVLQDGEQLQMRKEARP